MRVTSKASSDHYWGIKNSWHYGPIFCSPITRRLLLTKYPKLEHITFGLELNVEHTIPLN